MRPESKANLQAKYNFGVDCENCSRIEVGCAECEIITELLDEVDRLQRIEEAARAMMRDTGNLVGGA